MGVQLISFACFHDRIMSNSFLSISYANNALIVLPVLDTIILVTIASSCVNAMVRTRTKNNDVSIKSQSSRTDILSTVKLPPTRSYSASENSRVYVRLQLERGNTRGNRI